MWIVYGLLKARYGFVASRAIYLPANIYGFIHWGSGPCQHQDDPGFMFCPLCGVKLKKETSHDRRRFHRLTLYAVAGALLSVLAASMIVDLGRIMR